MREAGQSGRRRSSCPRKFRATASRRRRKQALRKAASEPEMLRRRLPFFGAYYITKLSESQGLPSINYSVMRPYGDVLIGQVMIEELNFVRPASTLNKK
jgi:hypothetical protein